MAKKDITPADVSRSLNRLEGFIDDLLPNIQSLCERNIEDVWTQLSYWVTDVHNNREGDNKNYIGVRDCVDYTLNYKSIDLAKRAFSIEAKVKEIESFVLPYISNQITQKVASEFLWETGRILWQIGELHIETFVIDDENDGNYPDIPNELKNLFTNESQCTDFVKRNYGKTAAFVAYAYMDEHGVIYPSDANNSTPVIAILFRYFVEPFIKGKKEKESARTGFYKYFK